MPRGVCSDDQGDRRRERPGGKVVDDDKVSRATRGAPCSARAHRPGGCRYCKGYFTDTYKKTIGVDFMEKTLEVDDVGESVRLMVWDTAGQEEFDSLTSRYYKGAVRLTCGRVLR